MYYRLSRFSSAHKLLRKAAYAVLWRLPDGVKFGIGGAWRRFRLPYCLLRRGDTAVQIGAPWDTLKAGRSRAAHFARFVSGSGRTVVIEPDSDNICALEAFKRRHALEQVQIVPLGAWSRRTRLRFLRNPTHPASNLVEDAWKEPQRERHGYEVSEIDVDTVDSIATSAAPGPIRLLSITTNGAELDILNGALETLRRVEYVSIITLDAEPFLTKRGFRRIGHDDRGYTYRHVDR